MLVFPLAAAVPRADGALALAPIPQHPRIVWLPRILPELTEIQLHVLARVATHCWTHGGTIPYVPSNAYQASVAAALAEPSTGLLEWVPREHVRGASSRSTAYRLSRPGELAARRVLHVVPAQLDRAREKEFDRMRRLMCNTFDHDDEAASAR